MPPRSPKLRPPCPVFIRAGGAKWYCTVGRKGHGGNHVGNRSEDEYRRLVAETKQANEEIMATDNEEALVEDYTKALEVVTAELVDGLPAPMVGSPVLRGMAERVAVCVIDALHNAGFILHYTGPRDAD